MSFPYRNASYYNLPSNREIVEVLNEIERLEYQLQTQGIRGRIESLKAQRNCYERIIDHLGKWIKMASDGAINIDQIREELQAEILVNEQLLNAAESDGYIDDYITYRYMKRLSDFHDRSQFIELILDEIFATEMRLRCIRAMIRIVENEFTLREEHKTKMDEEINELKENGKNEIRLKVIEKQRDVFSKTLENCEKIRRRLLAEEEKEINRIACDKLTIEKMKEFRYQIREPAIPRTRQRVACVPENVSSLKILLKQLDTPIEKWKYLLEHWKCECDRIVEEWSQMTCDYTRTQKKINNLMREVEDLRRHWRKEQAEKSKFHEEYIENEVKRELVINENLILEFKAETERLEKEQLQTQVSEIGTEP